MGRGRTAGNLKDPHKIRHRAGFIRIAPANVVQRVLHGLSHRLLYAVGHQSIEAGTFVHFIEMRQRLPIVQHPASIPRAYRRPIGVVEHSLHQVGRRQQIFQPLLILNPDGVAAKVVGERSAATYILHC